MKNIRISIILLLLGCCVQTGAATGFEIRQNVPVTYSAADNLPSVVQTAIGLLNEDLHDVFGTALQRTEGSPMLHLAIEKTDGDVPESFRLGVQNGVLHITGADGNGLAYGLMELSRLVGVSPWKWWADAVPVRRKTFSLLDGYANAQSPSVRYRGIFINDEDWGLNPWAWRTHEPAPRGQIGPRTHERIFELMLRLRANTFWPAMHGCSTPFFFVEGNREVAERYGIYIGTSHCEPMLRNTNGEWNAKRRGEYDYVHNRDSVLAFWHERVQQSSPHNLYTLGMRGVHDGAMQGARTTEERRDALARIIADQRTLLAERFGHETAVPQVFIPYKEVLDVYNSGLRVPDDVTLVWCDDNYQYITHFPTAEEAERRGGNGLYYHVSYWGRPHDYLWLGTANPALLMQQMCTAYERGIRQLWVLNVGDIKPSEYQIELFLDLAWNVGDTRREGVSSHLRRFLTREFGKKTGEELLPVLQTHYRLAYICKPEYLGNTRTEERDSIYKIINDLPWSEAYIRTRLAAYKNISDKVEKLFRHIETPKRDAYFELVKYPVQAAAQMNAKFLYAQLARHGRAGWVQSDAAFDSIQRLTLRYNEGFANRGKWKQMMDCAPRRLPVFGRVPHTVAKTPLPADRTPLAFWNGSDCTTGTPIRWPELGYAGKAAGIGKEQSLGYIFEAAKTDSIEVELHLLPTHPIDGGQLRIGVSVDGMGRRVANLQTQGRSEAWKQNVLRNQTVHSIKLSLPPRKRHTLSLEAIDEGVVVDQIFIYKTNRK